MKIRLTISFLVLATLTGCQIPAVSAKKARYDSAYPIGGTSISVDNAKVTKDEVDIGHYKRVTKWGWFSQTIEVEGYKRPREASEIDTIKTP